MPPATDSRRKIFRLLWIGTLLIGLATRFTNVNSGLEYDEIWTLSNFAPLPLSRILTDLALPNNHPLNTLGVKLCVALFDSPWTIRLPALLAGIGSLLLVPLIAFLWSRRKVAAWIATLIFALCHPVFLYAQQARGYSIQLFFLLLFATGFLLAGKHRPKRLRFLPETMVFFGGAGAVLTLPTSILYLGVITLIGYFLCRKTPFSRLPLRPVLAAGMILTAIWYLVNYQALQAARVWGIPVTGFRQFLELISDTMMQLNGPVVLLFALSGVLLRFRRGWPLLLFHAAAFGSALATNAGGVRVYLPLTVPTAILAGMGAEELFRRARARFRRGSPWLSPALFLLLAVLIFRNWNENAKDWPVRDWHRLHDEIRSLAPDKLVALDAGDGYPYCWNNYPEAADDYLQRLLDRSPDRSLVSFLPPGVLNGIDSDGGSRALPMEGASPETKFSAAFPVCRYRLSELSGKPLPGTRLLILLRPMAPEALQTCIRAIRASYPDALQLNPWLTSGGTASNRQYQAATLILHCSDPDRFDWTALRNRLGGAVSVYRILPSDEKNPSNSRISSVAPLEKRQKSTMI